MSNKFIKSIIPPILLIKFLRLRSYVQFCKFQKLVAKNVKLKDIHKGERCFLLGSGPSIKKENLLPLKDEIVFALNNFYVHDDFGEIMSGNKPKYYITSPIHPPQTDDEWKRWFKEMEFKTPKNVNMLFGINAYKRNIKYIFDKYEIFKNHKINWYFPGIHFSEMYSFSNSDIDLSRMILQGRTCSVYALIIAIYMGFDEIYLLGMDHNNFMYKEKEMRFYKNAIHQKDEVKRVFKKESYNRRSFQSLSNTFTLYEIFEKLDVSIKNLSKVSTIDIFEKDALSNILHKRK